MSVQVITHKSLRERLTQLSNQKKMVAISAAAVLLLFALITTVILTQQRQDLKQHASGDLNLACSLPLQPKILQIEYYPRDATNPEMSDQSVTGPLPFGQKTVAEQEAYVSSLTTQLIDSLNEASKFHGYKDPQAKQFLQYSVADTKKYYEKIPTGYQLRPGIYRPNYKKILTDANICDYVDNKGVTEVWMYGYHNADIEPDESRMSSKFGDISNSSPKEAVLPQEFRLPTCSKAYTLYNYNYARSSNEMLHNRIHQLENILAYASGTYPPNATTGTRGKSTFWGNFSEYVQLNTVHNYNSSCGNSHFTPNWKVVSTDTAISDEYRYDLQNSAMNNCETWNPDPAKSTFINASCTQWGCTERGYYMWYLQNMPGYKNEITFTDSDGTHTVRNWWEALYDPAGFLDHGLTLLGTDSYCVEPTATLTPSITPTLTPIPAKDKTILPITYKGTPTPTITIKTGYVANTGLITQVSYITNQVNTICKVISQTACSNQPVFSSAVSGGSQCAIGGFNRQIYENITCPVNTPTLTLTPTKTPEAAVPNASLSVELTPSTSRFKITETDTRKVVIERAGSVAEFMLLPGNYYVEFNIPLNGTGTYRRTTPRLFKVLSTTKTVKIIGNLTTGRSSVTVK